MFRILLIVSMLAVSACSDSNGGSSSQPAAASQTPARAADPRLSEKSTIAVAHGARESAIPSASAGAQNATGGASAGGLLWTKPERWVAGSDRPMRAATYRVPASSGDPEDGECAVFFFGPGQGGGVEANIDRWVGQFEQPDGKDSSSRLKRKTATIAGLEVTSIDLTGTYSGGMVGGGGTTKPSFRLLGAIVAGPQAPIFFKFTGPVKTVAAAEKEFESMLKSLRR